MGEQPVYTLEGYLPMVSSEPECEMAADKEASCQKAGSLNPAQLKSDASSVCCESRTSTADSETLLTHSKALKSDWDHPAIRGSTEVTVTENYSGRGAVSRLNQRTMTELFASYLNHRVLPFGVRL